MNVPLLDLKPQYAALRDEIRAAMDRVCDSQAFILGQTVTEFEEMAADYIGVRHAIGVSSGTDALLLALMALDIGPGDAVITSPYTFFATGGSISRLGATPVFVDIDDTSFNISPERVEALLTDWPERFSGLTPKALLPVHLYGQMADMDALRDLAGRHGLGLIEDAAQAIGSEYPSRDGVIRAGEKGDIGCFSFFPSKNLGGFGDGGLCSTNDDALAEKMRIQRVHGGHPKYYHKILGGNFRLDALQAAVLSVKLPHLNDWHAARRRNAGFYDAAFRTSSVITPAALYADSGATQYHIYNQYIVRVPERDRVRQGLLDAGVGCEIYYPVPLHLQECFSGLGYQAGDFPVSEKAAAETLALPIYPEMSEDMLNAVATALLDQIG